MSKIRAIVKLVSGIKWGKQVCMNLLRSSCDRTDALMMLI
uniref:Uncharacterized protein n=1 Tax=Anguilla anguilla TaxID=7936 RepID=A0A0E9W271_ANGAN